MLFGGEKVKIDSLRVALTASNSPANIDEVLYKIFDLTTEKGTFHCKDVTRADIINGHFGTYERNFSNLGDGFTTSLSDVLIWTGVTNDVALSGMRNIVFTTRMSSG